MLLFSINASRHTTFRDNITGFMHSVNDAIYVFKKLTHEDYQSNNSMWEYSRILEKKLKKKKFIVGLNHS